MSSELLLLLKGEKLVSQKGASSYEDEEEVNSLWLYLSLSLPYGKPLADLEPNI